jgi:hypothetical protein
MYEELQKLCTGKQIIALKMCNGSKFSKEDIQMSNRYLKKQLVSLIIREMQIKNTIKYHFIQISTAIITGCRSACL